MDPFDKIQGSAEPIKAKKLDLGGGSSDTKKPVAKEKPATPKKKPATTTKRRSTTRKSTTTKRRRRRTKRETSQVKRGSKLSASFFFIGCGLFLLIFVGLMIGGIMWVIQSEGAILESFGLEVEQIKMLLYMFVSLFLGLITLGLLFGVFLNIYRLATVKTSKVRYLIGLIASFTFLVGIIVFRVYTINEINKLSGKGKLMTTNPIISYVETRDEKVFAESGIPLIAPLSMTFKLNDAIYQRQIIPAIGGVNTAVTGFELDCGNGQKLTEGGAVQLAQKGYNFGGRCYFKDKEEYIMTLRVFYFNKTTGKTDSKDFEAGGFKPEAAIFLNPIDDEPRFNDSGEEYIIGVAPVVVEVESQFVGTDLGLDEDLVKRDFNADDSVDLENNTNFEHELSDSRLHKIAYQLPNLPAKWKDTRFQFDLRVVESDLANCELEAEDLGSRRRRISPVFDEKLEVSNFKYSIYDTVKHKVVKGGKAGPSGDLVMEFPEGAKYDVSLAFFTKDKNKGTCPTIEINEGYIGNQVEFTTYWKHELDSPYKKVEVGDAQVSVGEDFITTTLIPTTFQLDIDRVFPDANAEVQVFYNSKELYPLTNNIYEFVVADEDENDLEFLITTAEGDRTSQEYAVSASRNSVKALIEVTGDIVGEDPHDVVLDASVSPLYDEDDEIVFFTWDFGDGSTLDKVSQGQVEHTYVFDSENNKGEYYPSVKVETRKGYEDTYIVKEPVVVKRKQKDVELSLDSHPTQQARVGEVVEMSVSSDGLVDSIKRNFGNLKSDSCDSRSCSSTATTYTEPGTYEIKVEVTYKDSVPAIQRTKIRVF